MANLIPGPHRIQPENQNKPAIEVSDVSNLDNSENRKHTISGKDDTTSSDRQKEANKKDMSDEMNRCLHLYKYKNINHIRGDVHGNAYLHGE